MKLAATAVICATILGSFGCAADAGDDQNGTSDDALRRTGSKELTCAASSGGAKLALVSIKDGKHALVSLKPSGDLYAVHGVNGTLTTSTTRWSWTGGRSSLRLDANGSGTWERDGRSTRVNCTTASGSAIAPFRAANALTDYASEIDGLGAAILEDIEQPKPKDYVVYAVETSNRDSLSLGTKVRESSGARPGSDEGRDQLDENDFSYGAMSAAYSLGGGDDYGEYFQAASDGISLTDTLDPSLTGGARAGFIARKDVPALAPFSSHADPDAVEITVGEWTFFLPDSFPE